MAAGCSGRSAATAEEEEAEEPEPEEAEAEEPEAEEAPSEDAEAADGPLAEALRADPDDRATRVARIRTLGALARFEEALALCAHPSVADGADGWCAKIVERAGGASDPQ